MNSRDGLAFEHIQTLKNRVTRILRFIAFLSVVVITLIATIYSREHHSFFYKENCLLTSLLIALCGLSGWVAYLNIQKKFSLTNFEEFLEKAIVFLTIPLMYLWA
jgi:hypothetical protein